MTPALRLLAEQAAARLALALLTALAVTVLPTVVHSLLTAGPLDATRDLIEVVRWILIDLRPNGSF